MNKWFFDPQSERTFSELVTAIRHQRGTAVIGAGLSVAGGLPTWPEFYRRFCDDSGLDAGTYPDFDPESVASALQEIRNTLGEGRYLEIVDHIFNNTVLAIPEAYNLIASIFFRLVTTNFDNYLESIAYRRYQAPVIQVYPQAKMGASFVYLHGQARHARAPHDLVICQDDYEFAYSVELEGMARNWIISYLREGPCVFLGFSFSDPEITRVLEAAELARLAFGRLGGNHTETFQQSAPWFALLPQPRGPARAGSSQYGVTLEVAKRTSRLSQAGVQAIWYRTDTVADHENLINVLRELAQQIGPDSKRPEEPVFLFQASQLEALGALEDPDHDQRERAVALLRTLPEARRHFFAHATSPTWVSILSDVDLFPRIQEPVADSSRNARVTYWEAAPYLERLVGNHPELVASIINGIRTSNWHALSVCSGVAKSLPTALLATLTSRVLEWIQSPYFRVGLVQHNCLDIARLLGASGYLDSGLVIFDALIEHTVGQTGFTETRVSMAEAPRALEVAAELAKGAPTAVVQIFRNRLIESLSLPDNMPYARWSGWRESIGGPQVDIQFVSAMELYVSGLRDAMIELTATDLAAAVEASNELLDSEFPILRRVGLYVSSDSPSLVVALDERLFSERDLFDPELFREQSSIVRQQFSSLSDDTRARLRELIEAGPATERPTDEQQATQRREFWKWRYLRLFPPGALSEDDCAWLEQAGPRFEPLDDELDLPPQARAIWAEPPATLDDMRAIWDEGPDVFISVLRDPASRFPVTWRTGLGLAWSHVQQLVRDAPGDLLALSRVIERSDFDRGEAWLYLSAYRDLARDGVSFAWEPLIALSERLVVESPAAADPQGYEWARSVGQLLEMGVVAAHRIPDELLPRLLPILVRLVDLDFTPLDVWVSDTEDLVSRQLNSSAGSAASGLLLLLWRSLEVSSREGIEQPDTGRALAGQVQSLIERAFTSWGGVELRYAIGEYLFVIERAEQGWVEAHLDALLPMGDDDVSVQTRRAFWNGHLHTRYVYDELLTLLRAQYLNLLAELIGPKSRIVLPDTVRDLLADHIVIATVRRLPGWTYDDAMHELVANCGEDVRGHIAWFLSKELGHAKTAGNDDWYQRVWSVFDDHWTRRVAIMVQQPEGDYRRETLYFAFCLSSIPVPLAQVEDRVRIMSQHMNGGGIRETFAYLAGSASAEPEAVSRVTMELMRRLAASEELVWFPDNTRALLVALWNTGVSEAQSAVRDSVADILAKRQIDFRDILVPGGYA